VDHPLVVRARRRDGDQPCARSRARIRHGVASDDGLCLQWLARELRDGESVLDYGCGSGILAIAACRLGAARVVGTDIDPQAVAASEANALRNRVAATFMSPDRLAG
jgi:ribosomal protein L11 methylase PrmA